MPSTKDRKSKNKLLKIDVSSDSDSDGSEHELSYHAKDKVKLMKEVLKLIKPKKIKSMAPDCIKDLNIVDINSMLLEELLGISNKRLQYIFNGENVDRETSSSESEEEKQPIDVISLDDISDDDDIELLCISQNEKTSSAPESFKKNKKSKVSKIKTELVDTIKLEMTERSSKDVKKKPKKLNECRNKDDLKEADKDKLMSVLELLELQARARAIRSQLAIETEKKKEPESTQDTNIKREEESDSDAVIIESPENKEIIITSSDSEEESCSMILPQEQNENASPSGLSKHQESGESDMIPLQKKQKHSTIKNSETNNKKKKEKLLAKIQKIKLVRNKTSILNTDLNSKTDDTTIKPMDKTCNTTSIEDSLVTSDGSPKIKTDHENVLQDSIETLHTQSENNDNCQLPDSIKDTESNSNEDIKSEEFTCQLIKTLPQETHTKIVTYCDNDEIVINLDEDEMDGIEND